MTATSSGWRCAVLLPAFPGTTLPAGRAPTCSPRASAGSASSAATPPTGPTPSRALTAPIRDAAPARRRRRRRGGRRRHPAARPRPAARCSGAAALGAADDLTLTRDDRPRWSAPSWPRVGIDLDLGPVADVNSNPDNPVIGTRSFGADPAPVAAHVAAWLTGLQEAGVAACAKHFPGHGDTAQDSHLALPVVDADLDDPAPRASWCRSRRRSRPGVAAVMTSHIVVPALDPDLPGHPEPPGARAAARPAGLRRRRSSPTRSTWPAPPPAAASPRPPCSRWLAGADLLCLGADKDVALVREVQAAIVAAVAVRAAAGGAAGRGRRPDRRAAPAAPALRQPRRRRRGASSPAPGARSRVEGDAARPAPAPGWSRVDTAGQHRRRRRAVGAAGRPDRRPGPADALAAYRPAGRWSSRSATRTGTRRCARCSPRSPTPAARGRGRVGLARARTTAGCRGSARAADSRPAARRGDRAAEGGGVGPVTDAGVGLDIGATKTLGLVVDDDGRDPRRGPRAHRARRRGRRRAPPPGSSRRCGGDRRGR